MKTPSIDPPSPVRVNVSLCGSIPRKDMAFALNDGRSGTTPLKSLTLAGLNASKSSSLPNFPECSGLLGIISQNPSMARIQHEKIQRDLQHAPRIPLYDPPTWAVPAPGEARLEPVCEAVGKQSSVDLTTRSYFRIGRSPNSDIQLMHGTSSRRHALMFHHSNGSCYVVDCGSAHGTYVNGMQISSPPRGGVVIPHKVRRGAMIRFGGPGAPSFVLKSFPKTDYSSQPFDTARNAAPGDVVRLNTRINALGKSALDTVRLSVLDLTCEKRPFGSIFGSDSSIAGEPCSKRMRCSSPPLPPQQPIRLVSPCLEPQQISKRRVTFSVDPPSTFYPALVTPEDLSDHEDDNFSK